MSRGRSPKGVEEVLGSGLEIGGWSLGADQLSASQGRRRRRRPRAAVAQGRVDEPVARTTRSWCRRTICCGRSSRANRLVSACCSGRTSVTPGPSVRRGPASRPVDVALLVVRRIEVDHVRDTFEVEGARGDVRRNESRHLGRLEAAERPLGAALCVRSPCIASALTPPGVELLGQPVRAPLRADEDEREARSPSQQLDRASDLRVGGDGHETVVDLARSRLAGSLPRCGRANCVYLRPARRPRRRASRRRTSSGGRRGNRPTMRSTCGLKPMSSIRTALSRTRTSTASSVKKAWLEQVLQASGRRDEPRARRGRGRLRVKRDTRRRRWRPGESRAAASGTRASVT